jgi:tetratricopeptide (TPR) repeat protein
MGETMKKLFLFVLVYFGFTFLLSAQKSKVFGVFQLIEKEKYEEAKGIIEDAIKEKSTRKWPRTWYARGLICQNAYRSGIKNDDKALYELYPNQLYVAFSSFERARILDKRGRYDKLLPPKYVLLANDFRELGEKHFKEEEYEEALRAYQYALRINQSSILSVPLDTNLLYNTALSAYKSKKWDEAAEYFKELNEVNYSSNVPHLMFAMYIKQADTTSAQKVLLEGIKRYEDNEDLVLLLVDLLYKKSNPEKAIKILNDAFSKDSSNYLFPYTKGLLHQKMEEYNKAIQAYKNALSLPSDTLKIYTSIGTCYYNIGAEIEQKARTISNNNIYRKEKEKSAAAFKSALHWFEKAYELNPDNQETVTKLYQLYKVLNKEEKLKMLESTFE